MPHTKGMLGTKIIHEWKILILQHVEEIGDRMLIETILVLVATYVVIEQYSYLSSLAKKEKQVSNWKLSFLQVELRRVNFPNKIKKLHTVSHFVVLQTIQHQT